MPYLVLEDISFSYSSKDFTIGKINCNIDKGDILAIVGPSGCGKTTLLKIILGDIRPDTGSVWLEDKNITGVDIDKRHIGYVPQDQGLFPHLNVFDNIAIGLKSKKMPKVKIEQKIKKLAEIAGITPFLNRKISEISGGQKQRLSIIRSIAVDPVVLLLDEPFSGIDSHLKTHLSLYIQRVQKLANLTVVIVTHDINEAKSMANKILIMNKGKSVQFGSPIEVITHPLSIEVAKSMNMSNVFPKKVGSLFTNQKIQSFIRLNPNKINLMRIKEGKKGFQGIILSIIPGINTEIKTIIIQLTILDEDQIFIHVHKKLDFTDFGVNDHVIIELEDDCVQIF